MKQVLVIRRDLGMRKGKMIAQGAHASRYAAAASLATDVGAWERAGQPKIVVSAASFDELNTVLCDARRAGLIAVEVIDEGRTEFAGRRTFTAVGIGPAPDDQIDPITRRLPLL